MSKVIDLFRLGYIVYGIAFTSFLLYAATGWSGETMKYIPGKGYLPQRSVTIRDDRGRVQGTLQRTQSGAVAKDWQGRVQYTITEGRELVVRDWQGRIIGKIKQ